MGVLENPSSIPSSTGERSAPDARAAELLRVVHDALGELHRELPRGLRLTLDSALERELGLDSLARVELLLRVERAFGVTLPEDTLQLADTVRDVLAALDRAGHVTPAAEVRRRVLEPTPAGAVHAEPGEAATLNDVLEWHLREHPERVQVTVLSDGGEEEISYRQLRAGAGAIAAGLQRAGLRARETVAIMLPTSPDYFYTYYGVLLAGGIPVPIYPPARLSQIKEHVRRHTGILGNAQSAILVTVPEAMRVARVLQAHVPELKHVVTAGGLAAAGGEPAQAMVKSDDVAFIQYTSGSTSAPKGVVLTHANLLANIRAMAEAIEATDRDVFVSWLPLYHDMGLIGAFLGTLYVGCPLVIMSPLSFLARPQRWLETIHRFRGTLSAAPNFAYELTLKRIDDETLAHLDLSSWRLAFNGAEAVRPDTVTQFAERFGRCGFQPAAMTPVYGLAESAVGLLFPPLGRGPRIDRVRREPFARHGRAEPAPPDDVHALRFVSCGRPLPRHEARIVDDTGLEVPERVEGRLEFRGPSATSGYYRNPAETKRLTRGDGWLDSGDRAYAAQGEIYVSGRVKDIIIRGGRNIYPDELEDAVGAIPGVRKGCVAAIGSADPRSGTERLVLIAETRETQVAALDALRQAISIKTSEVLGEPADDIVLARPHSVLKTSSGKVRRSATRERYEAGALERGARAVWLQIAGLVAGAIVPELRRVRRMAAVVGYAGYVSIVFALIAPATWLVSAGIPRTDWTWTLSRRAARVFFAITRTPLVVHGLEHLPRGPNVLVANHASFLDGVVLVAALPRPYAFVAKRELREHFVSRVYLTRLGARFVERFAVGKSVEDARRLAAEAAAGTALAFFPEGTFRRMSGLLPFHLGAFIAALEARVPVVPVAIRGSRNILRAGQWLPRRGALVVTIGMPVGPPADAESSYTAATQLARAARAHILTHCGEPDTGVHAA
ncbi:MAG TPA: AMP-binding protein [Burkholderiales bacterium]|nr:AMP-binding protein [Burkholderiales bacterium]